MILVRVSFRYEARLYASRCTGMTRSSCEPTFLLAICSSVVYRHACAPLPSQLGHSSRTGTKPVPSVPVSYSIQHFRELVPV